MLTVGLGMCNGLRYVYVNTKLFSASLSILDKRQCHRRTIVHPGYFAPLCKQQQSLDVAFAKGDSIPVSTPGIVVSG
jgi:hypothetical protein